MPAELGSNTTTIYGPPGTGKTTLLLRLLAIAFDQGHGPDGIAFVSFTRAARSEARHRAMEQFGFDEDDLPWFRTMHSTGFKLAGWNKAQIMNSSQWRGFAKKYHFELSFEHSDPDADELNRPAFTTNHDKMRAMFEWGRHRLYDLEETFRYFPEMPKGVYASDIRDYVNKFNAFKAEEGLVDFHDMLEHALRIDNRPPVRIAFIDEAQDLTPLQIRVAAHWFADCEEVFVAGDDDQSIYNWSGADPDWLISMQKKSRDYEILDQSYRVPRIPHAIAERIIAGNRNRVEKVYRPADKRGVVQSGTAKEAVLEIARTIEDNRSTVFVLVRNRRFIAQWIHALVANTVPFVTEGRGATSPLGKPKLCRAAMNTHHLAAGKDISATDWRSMLDFVPSGQVLPRGTKKRAKENRAAVNRHELLREWKLPEFLSSIDEHGHCSVLIKDVEPAVRTYLQDLVAAGNDLTRLNKRPPVRITTVHGSKGREANLVVIDPNMTKRTHDGYTADEEGENRVAYVAVTRTRWALFFVRPEGYRCFPYDRYTEKGGAA